jgi:hypothetical protein
MDVIGAKRERVTFVRKARTQDAETGSFTVLETEVATRWASVKPVAVRSNEKENAGRLESPVMYLVAANVRGLDIVADDIIKWTTAPGGTVILNIQEVRTDMIVHEDTVMTAISGVVNSGTA